MRSPPVFVAVTIVRAGPASAWTNAPLELAVFTNTIFCVGKFRQERLVVVCREVGSGQVEGSLAAIEAAMPDQDDEHLVDRLGLRRRDRSKAFVTFSRVERAFIRPPLWSGFSPR